MLRNRVSDLRSGRPRAVARRQRWQTRPTLMALENRQLLSTFPVTSTADPATLTPGTLRYAVAQANAATSPSAIEFELGSGPATVALLQGQLELSNTTAAITIDDRPGEGPVTISGSHESRVFQIDSGVTASISGLTITGGLITGHGNGGGVANFGTATLTNCTISGNSAGLRGGGLYNSGATARATLNDCTVSGNSARQGGGIGGLRGTITLTNCTVSGNSASGAGGGIFNEARGITTLTKCNVSGNSASGAGGGMVAGDATLTNCTVSGNSASSSGGGLQAGDATLTNCNVSDNSAYDGAGCVLSAATLTNCTISGNSASSQFLGGGGLGFEEGTSTVTNCAIFGNSASYGAGVYNTGSRSPV